jgi:hypothetical protein
MTTAMIAIAATTPTAPIPNPMPILAALWASPWPIATEPLPLRLMRYDPAVSAVNVLTASYFVPFVVIVTLPL